MPLRHGAVTDVGRMRDGNEDSYLSMGPLAAVADGMGGHRGGEVASATAIDELRTLRDEAPFADGAAIDKALRDVIARANQRIREMAARDKALHGMGTTLTAVVEDGDAVHVAHIGDSRVYLLRRGELSMLTEDHTLVNSLVKQGKLTPEQAERHPQRSIITRALGVDADVEPDLATFKLLPGDRLLLCTDGLSGVVGRNRMRSVLQRVRDPQQAAERLVALANEAGGPDNITVIVLDTEGAPGAVLDATGELVEGPADGDRPAAGGGQAAGGVAAAGGGDPASLASGLSRVGPGAGRTSRLRARRERRGLLTGRRLAVLLLAVAVVAAGLVGLRTVVYGRWYVGFDGDEVAVFRGVPGDVAGLHFSHVVERTGITRSQVPAGYQSHLDDGIPADSRAAALQIALCAPTVYSGCRADGQTTSATTAAPSTTARPAPGAHPTTTRPAPGAHPPTTRKG